MRWLQLDVSGVACCEESTKAVGAACWEEKESEGYESSDQRYDRAVIFSLPLNQVNAERLEALKTDGTREGRHLEYKEALPGNGEDEKKEFLADATSFANAAGGDLIYGVKGRRDAKGVPTGESEEIIGLPNLNFDATQLRLENMIRDGVAPRMLLTFHPIPRGTAPPCLLLRIPRGWAGPHMITYGNWSRFYSRNSGGKYQLDVNEIRAGFLAAETTNDRIRRLRVERVARALAFETPAPVGEGPKLILHAFPVNASEEVWPRVCAMDESDIGLRFLPIIRGTAENWRFNLDGFVAHTLRDDNSRQCYTQLFRDGGIEALSGVVLAKDDRRGGFYPWGMEQRVIGALTQYQTFAKALGVAPPLLVGLTLSGVKGWKILQGDFDFDEHNAALDRDVVSPPEVMLSDLAAPADVVLRPLFDFIWNGGGWRGSPNYPDGRWAKPK